MNSKFLSVEGQGRRVLTEMCWVQAAADVQPSAPKKWMVKAPNHSEPRMKGGRKLQSLRVRVWEGPPRAPW